MTRKEKIAIHINKNGHGLEIGPSHNPVAPKKEGFQVDIIDHMTREELLVKYKEHPIVHENIEEVDYIWNGEPYAKLTGKEKHYDWIIASHLVEHTPDLIGFLKDCDTVLKDDGVLAMVVPDKRYCFDRFRPITGLAKIIDSFYRQDKIHTAGTVAEYYLNVVSKGGVIAWEKDYGGDHQTVHSLGDAIRGMELVNNHQEYIDVHSWCFVPHSFRLIIHDLFHLGLIPFKELAYYPTEGCEFVMILSREGHGIDKDRLEMLKEIDREQGYQL